ncbi:hypothetical protein [Leptospira alstonii]|uniref:hypothetical protein n=1 Tax=Leptospira alstonii TaxID=28452 RepID=UPI000774C1C0|nr:hypothetical protein [Leptospira alstonii]
MNYATEFREIPTALSNNAVLKSEMISLIKSENIPGKATEGGNRLDKLRLILENLVLGNIDISEAIKRVAEEIPRASSPHGQNNRVFPFGWEERLIRTQFSRFYNQAVLKEITKVSGAKCLIPHSTEESSSSECSVYLAGKEHLAQPLLDKLIESYSQGNFNRDYKIPHHPHCTHVVKPI